MPLVLASGAGAEGRAAIGLVVLFGVTIATLTTLLVVPGAYGLIARELERDHPELPVLYMSGYPQLAASGANDALRGPTHPRGPLRRCPRCEDRSPARNRPSRCGRRIGSTFISQAPTAATSFTICASIRGVLVLNSVKTCARPSVCLSAPMNSLVAASSAAIPRLRRSWT